jgi:hypothetical protein
MGTFGTSGRAGPERLSDETVAAIAAALRGGAAEEERPTTLRGALRAAAREARERGIPPGAVLAQLRGLWSDSPPGGALADAPPPLRELVEWCAREYWAEE